MYPSRMLKEYVLNSEDRTINDKLSIKMDKDLAKEFDEGKFNNFIELLNKSIRLIDTLNIRYPGNANPRYYVYIVPLEKQELLNVPKNFNTGTGGGKPVKGFELDGFNSAYAVTDNLCRRDKHSLSNNVHELTHLITGMFLGNVDRYISEGLSEAVPFYVLGFEDYNDNHRNMILNLKEEDIRTVKELIEEEKNQTYGDTSINDNKSCSYRHSYISSYLFIASILDYIKEKYQLDEKLSLQVFYKICKRAVFRGENMVYEMADELGLDAKELLESKKIQIDYINKLKNKENNKTVTK